MEAVNPSFESGQIMKKKSIFLFSVKIFANNKIFRLQEMERHTI